MGSCGSAPLDEVVVKTEKGADPGVVFWYDDLIIMKAQGAAARARLNELEGWRVVAVNGKEVHTVSEYRQRVKGASGPVRLRVAPCAGRQSAVRKIRRALEGFVIRSRLDDVMFRLLLRNLEIQEENEINMLKVELGVDSRRAVSLASPLLFDLPPLPPQRMQRMLDDLLSNGQLPQDKSEVLSAIAMAQKQHRRKSNVCRIRVPDTGRVTVVGDLHGQLADLLYILHNFGMPSPKHHILFNGDYVDRGECGVEVLLVLVLLSLLHPECMHLNRGNHEDRKVNVKYGFGEECGVLKYDYEVFNAIQALFEALPLMHVAQGVAVCHGGLPEFSGLLIEEIDRLDRFRPVPSSSSALRREDRVMQGLLWSDPKEDLTREWEKSKRGAGVYFSEALTDAFLKANRLSLLVRSHQTVDDGVKRHHNGKVFTVFSAAWYRGKERNAGAVLALQWQNGHFLGPSVPSWTGDDKKALVTRFEPQAFEETLDQASPKKYVLKRVSTMIFRRQVDLLRRFQEADLDETGTVTYSQWVTCMRSVLAALPWNFLGRHLLRPEPNGAIAYAAFLNRFQSGLLSRWVQQWCEAAMPFIVLRIGSCCGDIEEQFAAIDTDKTCSLSYHELFLFLTRRRHLVALDARLIYFVLQYLDADGDGFISLDEFRNVFEHKYNLIRGTREDNELMRMWEARVTTPAAYDAFEAAFRVAEKEHAKKAQLLLQQQQPSSSSQKKKKTKKKKKEKEVKGVPLEDFCNLAQRELGGDRARWARTADLASVDGLVRFKYLLRVLRRVSGLWDQAQSVADVLRTMSDSAVSLRSYFSTMDATGRGLITQRQFSLALEKFGIGRSSHKALWSLIDVNSDGYLSLREFLAAFEVVDVSAPADGAAGPAEAAHSAFAPEQNGFGGTWTSSARRPLAYDIYAPADADDGDDVSPPRVRTAAAAAAAPGAKRSEGKRKKKEQGGGGGGAAKKEKRVRKKSKGVRGDVSLSDFSQSSGDEAVPVKKRDGSAGKRSTRRQGEEEEDDETSAVASSSSDDGGGRRRRDKGTARRRERNGSKSKTRR